VHHCAMQYSVRHRVPVAGEVATIPGRQGIEEDSVSDSNP
jgi:hypothetical protein